MRKLGPLIFCFTLLSWTLPFFIPRYTLWMIPTSFGVVGSASLWWGLHQIVRGRFSGTFFIGLGVVCLGILIFLLNSFFNRSPEIHDD